MLGEHLISYLGMTKAAQNRLKENVFPKGLQTHLME
jgi:hypothetical protein